MKSAKPVLSLLECLQSKALLGARLIFEPHGPTRANARDSCSFCH